MPKDIKFDLSPSSITSAIGELTVYKTQLKAKMIDACDAIATKGMEVAQENVSSMGAVDVGDLIGSFSVETNFRGNHAESILSNDSDHAMFVEFGTGEVGEIHPYPYPMPEGVSWEYNSGATIKYNEEKGTYYWFYPGDDGKWHYTEGMPSRPYMGMTAAYLREHASEIAREVFRKS